MNNNEIFQCEDLATSSYSVIQSSQIVGYTNTLNAPIWSLYNLAGDLLYTSKPYLQWHTWIFDINTITDIKEGTLLILKAYDSGTEKTYKSAVVIEYIPNSNTAYFRTGPISSASIMKIDFIGIIKSANKPPILKCSKIYAYNDSRMITKWSFRQDGDVIFSSSRCRMDHSTTFNLSEFNFPPGTQFIFHADCIGGTDSEAYVLFEYDPLSNNFVNLRLYGNAFQTMTSYQGLISS